MSNPAHASVHDAYIPYHDGGIDRLIPQVWGRGSRAARHIDLRDPPALQASSCPLRHEVLMIVAKELRKQGKHWAAIETYEKLIASTPPKAKGTKGTKGTKGKKWKKDAHYALAVYHDAKFNKTRTGGVAKYYVKLINAACGDVKAVEHKAINHYIAANIGRNDPAINLRIAQLYMSGSNPTQHYGYLSKAIEARHIPAWEFALVAAKINQSNTVAAGDDAVRVRQNCLKSIIAAPTARGRGKLELNACESVIDLLTQYNDPIDRFHPCSYSISLVDSSHLRDALQIRSHIELNRLIDIVVTDHDAKKFYTVMSFLCYGQLEVARLELRNLKYDSIRYVKNRYYFCRRCQELSEIYLHGRGVKRDVLQAIEWKIRAICYSHRENVSVPGNSIVCRVLTDSRFKSSKTELLMFFDTCDKYALGLDEFHFKVWYYVHQPQLYITELCKVLSHKSLIGTSELEALHQRKEVISSSELLTTDLMNTAASYLPWYSGI
jgi:hypothetical protein